MKKAKRTNNLARHGDLNFRRPKETPKNIRKKKDNVLAFGEHTGHKHVIDRDTKETELELYIGDNGEVYMSVANGTATLTHQEHNPITFEPGKYHMKFERSYDYFLEEVKRVVD